jgi:sulfate adenylyltransferase
METISAHGGRLINRELTGVEREALLEKTSAMPKINLRPREVSDLEMIANGAFSPLEGFLCEDDYISVRDNKHLASGLPWTIPVTLSTTDDFAGSVKAGDDIALYADDQLLGVLHLEQKYQYDKQLEAERVYLTNETAHPGVAALYEQGEWLLGGKISLLNRPQNPAFAAYRLDPMQTREEFKAKGWNRVVAFQTRNPIHRAHEYIIKCALETVDGLLLHPLVGETKSDDIPADVRMKCYEVMLENYFPRHRICESGGDALRRATRSGLSRHHQKELWLYAFHCRARPRRRRQLLRHL